MLRITHSGYTTVARIELDGKLVGPWVDELRATIAALRRENAIRLNLARLSFADEEGLRLLRALRSDGVELEGALPLIAGLMAARIDCDIPEPSLAEHA